MVDGYLAIAAGAAEVRDDDSTFDRDLRWFTLEPYVRLGASHYLALRYSEIGTYDAREGYHFDGKTFAGGNGAFGYDVRRFQRLGLGWGWNPNPRVRAKFELGRDWFDLIDSSQLDPENSDRTFAGVEIAVRI